MLAELVGDNRLAALITNRRSPPLDIGSTQASPHSPSHHLPVGILCRYILGILKALWWLLPYHLSNKVNMMELTSGSGKRWSRSLLLNQKSCSNKKNTWIQLRVSFTPSLFYSRFINFVRHPGNKVAICDYWQYYINF